MRFFLVSLFFIQLLVPSLVWSSDLEDISHYNSLWKENITLAKKYLNFAELQLKNGNYKQACKDQRIASMYGVMAVDSLIVSAEISGSDFLLEDLYSTRKIWLNLSECRKE